MSCIHRAADTTWPPHHNSGTVSRALLPPALQQQPQAARVKAENVSDYLRLRRRISASPPRASRAIVAGSGTAVIL